MTPCIEVTGATVAYDRQPVLENINWTVKCGTLAAIIGPNGGGKSTLLRTLVGRLQPVQGVVRIFGEHPVKVRRRISYLPQNDELDWGFPLRAVDVVLQGRLPHTPWWHPFGRTSQGATRSPATKTKPQAKTASPPGPNAALPGPNADLPGPNADPHSFERVLPNQGTSRSNHGRGRHRTEIAMQALQRVRLEKHAQRPIGDLSGGQRQRVLLARALAQDAQLILLDEPATGLDATAQHDLLNVLQELKHEGRTVVATTHDLNCLTDCFDHVIGIRGRVICAGTPAETMLPEVLAKLFGQHVPMLTAEGRVSIVEHRD